MPEIRRTDEFDTWLGKLRDRLAKSKIEIRIRRLELGNPGDVKPVGNNISELRIDYGPGYRVYYTAHGNTIVILLCGGDKGSQDIDVKRAKKIASNLDWSSTDE
jgi:putative addiction module killer protein